MLDYVADVIVNDCTRPNPAYIFRYHGRKLPEVSMTIPPDGILSIAWDQEYSSNQFPATAALRPDVIVTIPVSVLVVRYVVCWAQPKAKGDGNLNFTEALRDTWDADSAMLADVADVVMRALTRLNCDDGIKDDEQSTGSLIDAGCHKFRFKEANPIGPEGGQAGVEWRSYVNVRTPASVS